MDSPTYEPGTKRLLVACKNKDDFFIDTIAFRFKKESWVVEVINSFSDARNRLEDEVRTVVIIDSTFANAEALLEHIKCDKHLAATPVIQLLGGDVDPLMQFRFDGSEQFAEPFEVTDVFKAADKMESEMPRKRGSGKLEVSFALPTMGRHIDYANELIVRMLANTRMDPGPQEKFAVAFSEALGNAAAHGNQGKAENFINVRWTMDLRRIQITISDMGAGFDWKSKINPERARVEFNTDRATSSRGGMGMLVMFKNADEVDYSEFGNEVTLTKYIDPEESHIASRRFRARILK